MPKRRNGVLAALLAAVLGFGVGATAKKRHEAAPKELAGPEVLWRRPNDIASRNLFYGPGGEEDAPQSTLTFVKEDLSGTSPKFDVRDENGVKWKVKLGAEARPEVVATRLVWAVGYSANEDYFLPELRVEGMPAHPRRGQELVEPDGLMRNVRLKRYLKGEKKLGDWRWRHNPFEGTRELNGLRVVMALINNWDLKDDNNSVYSEKDTKEEVYLVSDLGSSFGTAGPSWTITRSKGNLESYRHCRFISKTAPEFVDFNMPTRPALDWIFDPGQYFVHLRMHWIGRHIPRADVEWIAQWLAQLSSGQIRDAFRAAGYSPEEVDGFANVVEKRIDELTDLPRS